MSYGTEKKRKEV